MHQDLEGVVSVVVGHTKTYLPLGPQALNLGPGALVPSISQVIGLHSPDGLTQATFGAREQIFPFPEASKG